MTKLEISYGKLSNQNEEHHNLAKNQTEWKYFVILNIIRGFVVIFVIFVTSIWFYNGRILKFEKTEIIGTPATILESLNEGAVISGSNWEAWKSVKDSTSQHICKVDDGVESSGSVVLKKYNIDKNWQKDPPIINVDIIYQLPAGHRQTGIIAIDHWIDATGVTEIQRDASSMLFIKLAHKEKRILNAQRLEKSKIADEKEQALSDVEEEEDMEKSLTQRAMVSEWVEESTRQNRAERAVREEEQRQASKEAKIKAKEQEESDRKMAEHLAEADKVKQEADDLEKRAAEKRKRQVELEEKTKSLTKKEPISEPGGSVVPVYSPASMEQLGLAIGQALGKMMPSNSIPLDQNSKFLARQSYAKDLPTFSGKAEEWPLFFDNFENSTKDCGFTDSDNASRLAKCLKGDALEYVQSLLVQPKNVPVIMQKLEVRYGQPENIIKAMIAKAKGIPSFKEDQFQQLIKFGSAVSNAIATIQNLNRADHLNNPQLLEELESKLPRMLFLQWRNWVLVDGTRTKDLVHLGQWMDSQVAIACSVYSMSDYTKEASDRTAYVKNRREKSENELPTIAGLFVGEKSCIFCGKHSESQVCFIAEKIPLEEKQEILRNKRLCFTCLKPYHMSRNCQADVRCKYCERRHPSSMCPGLSWPKKSEVKQQEVTNQQKKFQPKVDHPTTNPNISSENLVRSCDVILKTLMVPIKGQDETKLIRAFIDDGAQSSYILKKVAKELGLQPTGKVEVTHTLFGGVTSNPTPHLVYEIEARHADGIGTSKFEVRDQEKICDNLPRVSRGPWLKELKGQGVWLSDLGDGSPEIEMLLGADTLATLYTPTPCRMLNNGLVAMHTVLGWTLVGKPADKIAEQRTSVGMHIANMFVSEASVEQLWSLETIGIRDPIESKTQAEKDELAKQHFLKTVSRLDDGRYAVNLPWIDGRPTIPNNRAIAQKRLESTTLKLNSIGQFLAYDKNLKGWEEESFIEEVLDKDQKTPSHYLPHRAVFKPESLTTPLRPVFDASCHATRTPSLNDCLEKGPNLLELIPSILLRFREKKIGIISDIRKAFQMIEVKEEDRDFLRFLWWSDSSQNTLKILRHRRVVFGVNCSPFLLAAVLEHLLTNYVKEEHKGLANQLLKSLYVDNCVTSMDTIEEAMEFKKWSTDLLAEAKMDLREWECGFTGKSGIGLLTSSGCGLDCGRETHDGKGREVASVLGYKWDKVQDTIQCDLTCEDLPMKVNKRLILSFIQRVYDPIGFTCPATLIPKLLIQRLWSSKIGWDVEVTPEYRSEFDTWCKELKFLQQIRLPRNLTSEDCGQKDWQVHTFCDASKDAYAAVVFLQTDNGSSVTVQLIAAKARVAPLKKGTINRLELMSCLIGSTLANTVKEGLSMKDVPFYYWTDSSTALAWIKRNDEWGTFVGNRVKTICSVSDENTWRHVPGVMNPADLPSRGCTPAQLLESKWWEGPEWLKRPEPEWPMEVFNPEEELVIAEKKKTGVKIIDMGQCDGEQPWYLRTAIFTLNVRILCWVLRFVRALKKKRCEADSEKCLTVTEKEAAEELIMKLVQRETIPFEESVIAGLRVEVQEDGLVHIKSKLKFLLDREGDKSPTLLPNMHPAVDQLIRLTHLRNKHAGAQFVLTTLRRSYWIIHGRKAVRRVLQKCVTCRRFSEKRPNVEPASLPEDRVRTGKVFEISGVDLARPIVVSGQKKTWIVLFTCSVYRCIHLELVKSLTTEAFMDAFSRFTSRRGRPTTLYCDNGTNFVGADNALKELDWESIKQHYNMDRIRWRFNPPSSPWWGGWWERLIRSVKDLLRRSLGKTKMSYDKFVTVLCEVEAIINGRPLTTVTEDPDDLVPLTPAMFLNEMPTTGVTDRELLASGFQRLIGEKHSVTQQIRTRFQKEYLALLVHRGKDKKVRTFHVGEVVLIGSDNKKRWEWPMARILELLPGRDGHVRVAKLKTATGILIRPVQWIFPMEVSSSNQLGMEPVPTVNVERDEPTSELETEENAITKNISGVRTRYGREVKQPERFGQ